VESEEYAVTGAHETGRKQGKNSLQEPLSGVSARVLGFLPVLMGSMMASDSLRVTSSTRKTSSIRSTLVKVLTGLVKVLTGMQAPMPMFRAYAREACSVNPYGEIGAHEAKQ
jgi:hypothetical protein